MSIIDSLQSIATGNFGFNVKETMTGYHEFEPGMGPKGKHRFEFIINWGPNDIKSFLNPIDENFLVNDISGKINVCGLGTGDCFGRLKLKYFKNNSIKYDFKFNLGSTQYKYVGEKVNIRPWNLLTSHTTCFGTITEVVTGKLVSRSVTYFKLRTILAFLASFRLVI